MAEKLRVAIGIPVGPIVVPEFALSLGGLCYKESKLYNLTGLYHSKGCYITENRNRLVELFLNMSEADWLLQFDTDMSFDDMVLEKLCQLVIDTNSKIVGGWYYSFIKGEKVPLTFVLDDKGFQSTMPWGEDPFKVDGIATGCLMIHKDVFRDIKKDSTGRVFYFSDTAYEFPKKDEHEFLGEDLVFSVNCKRSGFSIYTKADLKVKHHKMGEM